MKYTIISLLFGIACAIKLHTKEEPAAEADPPAPANMADPAAAMGN